MISTQQATTPFQSASLYVGDLHNEVTESLLFELFNRVGPVASIRVCRDSVTRRSLGYAYVNFHNVQDAERALDTMNFTEIKGRPCRIMWSQRDPSLRKSGVGNVFVRNLAPSVDNKGLYDTFSVFGNILSCKVATDENGASKGYGYVHFETAEAATDAIQKFNGTLIDEVEVHVGSFVKRQDRAGVNDWTNLYVKMFPTTWDEAKLQELFTPFGAVANVAITKVDGVSKGFGFVNFADHESAAKALEGLSNKSIEDEAGNFELYVSRAQKKNERTREIKTRLDALNQEKLSKFQGMNLYVKNVADTITDEQFREAFAPFGTITSARVMRDGPLSKGFGFICYSAAEEANRAVAEMNSKVLGGKPLMVTLHQRKEHRRAHLAATYNPNGGRGGFPQGQFPGMQVPPYMNMYMQPGQQGFPQGPRGVPIPYPGPMGGRGQPRGMPFQGRGGPQGGYFPGQPVPPYMQGGRGAPRGIPGAPQYVQQVPGGAPMMPGQPGLRRPVQGVPPQGMMPGQPGMMPRGPMGIPPQQMRPGQVPMGAFPPQMMQQGQPRPLPGQQVQGGIKFTNQVRNQGMPQQGGAPQQGQQVQQQASGNMDFSDAVLASADPVTQKNMIGERLYPLIYQHQPEQAGKITGMLLEMDNGELLNLIESPEALMSKIEEALTVLRNHKGGDE